MELAKLFVTIAGIDAPLNATLAKVRQNLTGFAGSFGSLHMGLAQILGIGGLGAAVGAAVGTAVHEAMSLEKAYSQIRKTTGMTGVELDQLKKKLETLATTMAGVSVEEVLDVAAMAGRLGINGVEGITEFTKAISMIRIALDDIPAEEAATRISRILNVFKLGPEAALDFASALNKLDDTSTATGREILEVTQRMSGIAATLGLTPQKVLALASVLKDAGVETHVAGTGMDHILMKMATDAEQFAKVAGVSMKDFSEAFSRDPIEALKLLMAGLADLSAPERMKALDYLKLTGHMTGATLLQLASVMGKLDPAIALANEEWKTHASINREVAIQAGIVATQLTMAWNSAKLLASDMGGLLLPAVKELAGGLGELALMVRENFASIQEAVTPAIEGIRAGIEGLMASLRNLGSVWAYIQVDAEEYFTRVGAGVLYLGEVFGAWFDFVASAAYEAGNLFLLAFMHPIDTIKAEFEMLTMVLKKLLAGELPGVADFVAAVPDKMMDAIERIKPFKMPEFKFDASGFDAERQKISDDMANNERKRLDDKARAAAAAAQGKDAKKPEEGTGKAPGKDTKVFSGGLEEFAKHLQEGIFGKDAAQNTADNTARTAKGIETLQDKITKLFNKLQGAPGVAVGPP